jgi:pimeloyl-ACP methyl ester carboxylesterase
LESHYISANNVKLHTILDGPKDGEPIVFLHGFPDFWYGWHHQIPFFAAQGYRVIVPDQRGYNLSDKPGSVDNYHISILAKDIIALIDALSYETVHLVGHDWGGAVAWWVARMFPQRLKTLNILNAPYPTVMAKKLRGGSLRQLARSWYMFFFQIPWLPEALTGIGRYEAFADTIRRTANPGSFTDDDLKLYREAWSQPGAMTGMINWYRALLRSPGETQTAKPSSAASPRFKIPTRTQILWGEQDLFIEKDLAVASLAVCEDGEVVYFPRSTHWIQHDEPDDVNRYILEFIARKPPTAE